MRSAIWWKNTTRSGFDGRPVAEYMAAIASDPVDSRVAGGESLRDYWQRVAGFLDELRVRGEQGVLLLAHEETLRVFKGWCEGLAVEQVVGLPFENCRPYPFVRP